MESDILTWPLLCLTGMVITLSGEHRGRDATVAVGKLVAATAYVMTAWSVGALNSEWGRWLFLGMLFCWGGDLCLVSRRHRGWFLAGLLLFLLGHILYGVSFGLRGLSFDGTWPILVFMGVFVTVVYQWLRPHLDRRMVLPVTAYLLAISLMWALAVMTHYGRPATALLAGATLFVISDLAVARNRFVRPGIVNRIWGLPMYFSAQLLLAFSTSQ